MVQQALGDTARRDQLEVCTFEATAKPGETVEVPMKAISVLTVSEAANQLGISTGEMEAMVKRETVKSVLVGWTAMVPTSEVERLLVGNP